MILKQVYYKMLGHALSDILDTVRDIADNICSNTDNLCKKAQMNGEDRWFLSDSDERPPRKAYDSRTD